MADLDIAQRLKDAGFTQTDKSSYYGLYRKLDKATKDGIEALSVAPDGQTQFVGVFSDDEYSHVIFHEKAAARILDNLGTLNTFKLPEQPNTEKADQILDQIYANRRYGEHTVASVLGVKLNPQSSAGLDKHLVDEVFYPTKIILDGNGKPLPVFKALNDTLKERDDGKLSAQEISEARAAFEEFIVKFTGGDFDKKTTKGGFTIFGRRFFGSTTFESDNEKTLSYVAKTAGKLGNDANKLFHNYAVELGNRIKAKQPSEPFDFDKFITDLKARDAGVDPSVLKTANELEQNLGNLRPAPATNGALPSANKAVITK